MEHADPNSFWYCGDTISCTELATDLVFITEILVAFNTVLIIMDGFSKRYILSRIKIARSYFCGWLLIDFLAVLPRFLKIGASEAEDKTASEVFGIVKFARIARIIKLVRLVKLFKSSKSKG